jgi:DNA polymerase-4
MKRIIFLVDMNAFFISCEMSRNESLRGIPSAVAGDPQRRTGIILAANYEARAYGVKTAMVVHKALKLCPELKLVPPDHKFYSKKSHEVMELLARYSPLVEQNSIDEAWLDMTGCEDLFGQPLESAKTIMKNINDQLNLWCSIGISENKFLAKMASNMKKPQGITELWKADIKDKLWPLKIQEMHGVGKQTSNKLREMNINTIGDLARFPQNKLSKRFGKQGVELHRLANGIDDSPVIPHGKDEMKSIGRSITLPKDLTDFEEAKKVILQLVDDIALTAREHNKHGRTVQITIKYKNFQVITRQTTIGATNTTSKITDAALKLLKENWNPYRPVRLLGVSLSGFEENSKSDQISFFDLPAIENTSSKEAKLDKAIDEIKKKYGTSTIKRAILIEKNEKW